MIEEKFFPKPFDCLHLETSVWGNRFLEAAAGTGKTFALEHVFTRLLLEQKEKISFEQILVVTFTRAATRDLKERILKNLEKIFSLLKKAPSERIFEEEIFYLEPFFKDEKKRTEAIQRLEEVLCFFEKIQIYTIHSFCYRMLQEFFFAGELTLDSSREGQASLEEEFFDFLRDSIPPSLCSAEQLTLLLRQVRDEKLLLKKLFLSREKKKELSVKKFSEFFEEFCLLCEQFQKMFPGKMLLKDRFERVFSFYKSSAFSKNALFEEVKIFHQILEENDLSSQHFSKICLSGFSIGKFLSEENLKKRNKGEKPLEEDLSFFFKMKKTFEELFQKASHPEQIFLCLAKEFDKRFQEWMDQKELLTESEILKKMQKTLEKKAFCESVQKKYRAVLVDEFQDTDLLQWEIFEKLFLSEKNELSAFFLVGDPKQSIYGFRNADLAIYFKAFQKLGQEAHFCLDRNYRATPSLIESCNKLFSQELAFDWLKDPQTKRSIPYFSVRSGREEEFSFGDEKAPIHFFVAEDVLFGKRWPSQRVEEEKFFPFLAKEISFLKQFFPYSQIAILVKDRYQQERVETFLKDKNIPVFSQGNTRILESSAFFAMKKVFLGMIFREDFSRLKEVLLGPYIGWDVSMLEEVFFSDSMKEEVKKNFSLLHEQLIRRGIPGFFSEFFEKLTWNGKTVLETILEGKNNAFYQEALHVFDLLLEYEKQRKREPLQYLRFFEELEEKKIFFEEGPQKFDFSEGEEGVQVLTLHKSKGLEFEVVFALGVASRTLGEDLGETREQEEREREKIRQFYVAVTRAKKRVYIPLLCDQGKKRIFSGSASILEIFYAQMKGEGKNFYSTLEELSFESFWEPFKKFSKNFSFEELFAVKEGLQRNVSLELTKSVQEPEKFLETFLSKKIFSFSSLMTGTSFTGTSLKAGLNPTREKKNVPDLPKGSDVGIFFHQIFEKIFSQRKKAFFDKGKISQILEEEIFLSPFQKEFSWIQDVVTKTLKISLDTGEATFCLEDLDLEKTQTELEFFFPFRDEWVQGVIDLIFFHQGKYYLIDWKSNDLGFTKECYQRPFLEKVMEAEGYFLQASIYAEAYKRFLRQMNKPEESFGGVFYLFLRGISSFGEGIFHFFPGENYLQDRFLDGTK